MKAEGDEVVHVVIEQLGIRDTCPLHRSEVRREPQLELELKLHS